MTTQDLSSSTQVRSLRFIYEQDMSEKAHGRRLTVQELLTDGSHNNDNVATVRPHNPNYHSAYPSQSRSINVTQHQHHHHLSTRDVDSENNTLYPQHLNISDKPDYPPPQLLTPSTSPCINKPVAEMNYGCNSNHNHNHGNHHSDRNDRNDRNHHTQINYANNISSPPTHHHAQQQQQQQKLQQQQQQHHHLPTHPHTPAPTPSPFYTPLPMDDNTAGMTISLSERRERNKLASAKYRKKKQIQNQEMSTRINDMSSKISSLNAENSMLRKQLEEMKVENQELKDAVDKLKSKIVEDKILKRLGRTGTTGKIGKIGTRVTIPKRGKGNNGMNGPEQTPPTESDE